MEGLRQEEQASKFDEKYGSYPVICISQDTQKYSRLTNLIKSLQAFIKEYQFSVKSEQVYHFSFFTQILQTKPNHNSLSQTMSAARQLSIEAKQYESQEFKMLYTYIKTLNLINSLYLSQAMSRTDFEQEQKDILDRYNKIKQEIKSKNQYVDFERFAQLYNIEAEYKRILSYPKSEEGKKIIQVAIMLTSKITEIFDTIHQSKTVKDFINVVTQIDMLLKKLKSNGNKISPEFIERMDKISEIKENLKKKTIHDELSSMEMYELEDAITKIKLSFEEFSSQ